ncbi:PREDICTED: uncharacterized protein LOC109378262 [Hipposideros armiger]|uniref:Uncharacterized protein LOC109378262 n=1 Tax=Hipposideros armiger TaxID=186990 RepID=A0A8B7QQG3_HIPAR|nr:PREDICTED: uncharacterized protein LOC109378262 [Hipposideros armiger]
MELRPLLEPALQVSVMGSGRAPGESKTRGEQGAPALRNIDKLWGWPPAPNPAGPSLHSQLHLLHREMHRMGGGLVQWSLRQWCRVPVGTYKDSDITMVTSQASPPNRAKGGTNFCSLTRKTRAPSMEMASLTLSASARGTRLLCCVALCLLEAGSVDAGVTQSPTHLIKRRDGKAVLICHPMSGHDTVSWYQQAQGQGLQFLIQYYEKEERERGNIPDRFSAQQFNNYSSELTMNNLQLEDSAVYLCASSLDTALQG